MTKIKESDFISKYEIDYMVKTGKRYFSGTWKEYKDSPYAEQKRWEDERKKKNDIRD